MPHDFQVDTNSEVCNTIIEVESTNIPTMIQCHLMFRSLQRHDKASDIITYLKGFVYLSMVPTYIEPKATYVLLSLAKFLKKYKGFANIMV